MINGKQMMLVWHMDDMKISHISAKAVTHMIKWLKKTYQKLLHGELGKMQISRGKVHDYLGMTFNFTTPGEVKITMYDYINDMLNDFQKHDPTHKVTATPTADHLFKVRDEAEPLSEAKAKIFHEFTTKGLYLSKHA